MAGTILDIGRMGGGTYAGYGIQNVKKIIFVFYLFKSVQNVPNHVLPVLDWEFHRRLEVKTSKYGTQAPPGAAERPPP